MRTCIGCTACCYNPRIIEFNKPERVMCDYCDGSGCTRYDTKPRECSTFKCMWLTGHFQNEDRPDVSGVMVEDHGKFVFVMSDSNEWQKMAGQFDTFVSSGIPVVVGTKEKTVIGLPTGMSKDQVTQMINEALNGSS